MTFAGSIPVGELLPPSEVFPKVEVDGVVVPVVRGSSEPISIIIIIITIIIIILIIMVSSEAPVNLKEVEILTLVPLEKRTLYSINKPTLLHKCFPNLKLQ